MNKKDSTAVDEAVEEIEQKEKIEQAVDAKSESPSGGDTDAPASRTSLRLIRLSPSLSRRQKIIIAVAAVLALVVIVFAVPFLRYGAAGILIKKPVTLRIVDAGSSRPVSGVRVTISTTEATTNREGIAEFSGISVGEHFVTYEKKNYDDVKSSILVPILSEYKGEPQKLTANGRTLELKFVDSISGAVVKGVTATTEGAVTTVDDSGTATMVFAANPVEQPLQAKADGYNTLDTRIDTSIEDPQTIKLVPSGRVYFLSKRTGTISVMSAQLDGSDVREVLRGTGREGDDTSLLSSPDWRHAMLIARRDEKTQLYSLDLATGAIRLADDRDVYVTPIGWANGRFYYKSNLSVSNSWTDKASAIMSFSPTNNDRRVIDETVGIGDSYHAFAAESIVGGEIVGDKIIYAKYWTYGQYYSGERGRPVSFMSISTDTATRNQLRQLNIDNITYAQTVLKSPAQLLVGFGKYDGSIEAYRYSGSDLTRVNATAGEFDSQMRSTYMISPDGKRVVWSEPRDGQNVSFIANRDLSDRQEISRSEYTPTGWVGDKYVLYSRSQSQLYITAAGSPLDGAIKLTDYHRPAYYPGYGYAQ